MSKITPIRFKPWFKSFIKTMLLMKLSWLLIMISCLQVSARTYSQEKFTLSFNGVKLEKALKEIEKKSDFRFVYSNKFISKQSKISLSVKDATLDDVLDLMLKNTGLTYIFPDAGKLVVISNADENIKPVLIKGRVVDMDGNSMKGVSVHVKGNAAIGTTTDENGNFQLPVPDNATTLIFSYVGYAGREVSIVNRETLSIVLQAETKGLNDVVVIGYGTKKKVNLTGAISVVKGSDIENRPVLNTTQSLQGIVPGLNVTVSGNTKPGQSFNLNIRGTGNLSGGDVPLVLVDGMAMSLSDVNPNDIESISVLKDAAASAVYGARAAYGVILVTTKKGKKDHNSISYSNNYGFTSPINLPKLANSYEFAQYFNAATFNALGSKQYSDQKLALLKKYVENPAGMNILPEANDNYYSNWQNTSNGVANTDWFNFHYKPYASRNQHNLSVSGGNKITQYFVSGGEYSEGGIMRYADINYHRYNFNATLSSQLTKWALIQINTKFTQSKYSAPFTGTFETLFFHNLARFRPNVSPYDLNGNFNDQSQVPYLQSGSKDKVDNYTLALIPELELEPIKDWKIIANLNLRRDNLQEAVLQLPGVIYGIDGTPKFLTRSEFNIPLTGSFARNINNNFYISPNIYSTFNYKLNNKHFFTVMIGFQQELNEFNSLSSSTQDLISASRPGISLTTGTPTTQEIRTHWATQGYFGRLNYNYRGKYLFELNGRYDGSSRFAANNRWGFFPSMSLGYNLAKEKFMKHFKNQISLLKIRASYGLLGNQAGAGLYSYAQSMNVTVPGPSGAGGQWYFQDGREAYISAPAPFNPNTTWEKVQIGNIGIDFEALDNRLSGSFDIFQRSTTDMLGPTNDIADMFGGISPLSNNSSLRTKGWELSVSWRSKLNKNIEYSVGGVLSDYISMVTKYQNPTNSNPSGAWYEGKTVGEIWGYKASGLIQTKEEADAFNNLNHSYLSPLAWVPGDVRYLDLNKDGRINNGNNKLGDMGDLTIIGNSSPRYSYSINGSINWKGISLYLLFQGIGKMDYAPAPNDYYFWGSGPLAQVTVFKQHLNYWAPNNPNAYYPNPYTSAVGPINTYINKTQQVSNRYLQNAAYLRLKNVTIGYALPSQLIHRIKLDKLTLFISGENIFTVTKLAKMFDPETLVGGVTTGKVYPLNKVYSFGMNIVL